MKPYVCPACKSRLTTEGQALLCNRCTRRYSLQEGFPSFLLDPQAYADLIAHFDQLVRMYGDSPFVYAGNVSWIITMAISWNYRLRLQSFLPEMIHLSGKKVLEVGCGTGRYAAELTGTNEVFGIDLVPAMLKLAQGKGIIVSQASATHLPFEDEFLDVVLCLGVIPYFSDPTPLLQEIRRVLRPNGTLFLASPLKSGIRVFTAPIAQLLYFWKRKRFETVRKYSLRDVLHLMTAHGFHFQAVKTLYFPFSSTSKGQQISFFQRLLATEALVQAVKTSES